MNKGEIGDARGPVHIRHDTECDHGKESVEGDKSGDGLPNSPPPRVGAHANEEGEEGHDTKAKGHMGQVTRTSPLDAEEAILLLTAIANALREIAAFEGRKDLLPIAVWVGYP